jgi:hypothetical protein
MLTDSDLDEMYHKADCGSFNPGRGTLMDLIEQARLAVKPVSELASVLAMLESRYEQRSAEFGKHPKTDQMAVLSEIEEIERLVRDIQTKGPRND